VPSVSRVILQHVAIERKLEEEREYFIDVGGLQRTVGEKLFVPSRYRFG
jgi:hypothetical protein